MREDETRERLGPRCSVIVRSEVEGGREGGREGVLSVYCLLLLRDKCGVTVVVLLILQHLIQTLRFLPDIPFLFSRWN